MVDIKDYGTFDKVIPFLAGFIDRAIDLVNRTLMVGLHTVHSDLSTSLPWSKSSKRTDGVPIEVLRWYMKEFKWHLKARLCEICETALSTQKLLF